MIQNNFNKIMLNWFGKVVNMLELENIQPAKQYNFHSRPSARTSTKAKIVGAHVCNVTFKHHPQPLRSKMQSVGTL